MPAHNNDATKVLIIGKKTEIISAIVETLTQTGLEQEYKILQEDHVAEILKTINEMRSGDNF